MGAAGQERPALQVRRRDERIVSGPSFTDDEIAAFLASKGYKARRVPRPALAEEIAGFIAAEKVVGLLLGRMEFGPRALGGRSIVGDERSPKMQSVMNLKIKFRESFRPFAPAAPHQAIRPHRRLPAGSISDRTAHRGGCGRCRRN